MDRKNLTILKKNLIIPKLNGIEPISGSQIEKWYHFKFRPETTFHYGGLRLIQPKEQHGGGIEEYIINDVPYLFKIDRLEAQKIEVVDDKLIEDDKRLNIYFLSQLSGKTSINYNCIHLIVYPILVIIGISIVGDMIEIAFDFQLGVGKTIFMAIGGIGYFVWYFKNELGKK